MPKTKMAGYRTGKARPKTSKGGVRGAVRSARKNYVSKMVKKSAKRMKK